MQIEQLYSKFLTCSSVATDTRNIEKNTMFFALTGDNFNGNTFALQALQNGAKYAVIDQKEHALDNRFIVVENTLDTLQKLATYHRQKLNLKIIAITGSNGKTTTKELILAVLSQAYKTIATKGNLNNHIGVPLTLLSMQSNTQIGIVEMGANHKKEIELLCKIAQPDYGYITNFGKAHLEGFGGIEGVIEGKSEIYQYLINNNKLIFFNADDQIQVNKLRNYHQIKGYSQDKNKHLNINLIKSNPFVELIAEGLTIKSNLIGKYNFYNLAAAILIGKHFNINPASLKTALNQYVPKNNRSQLIKQNSNSIILDAYNANPTSMIAALDNFSNVIHNNKIIILGDMFELGDSAKAEHQLIAEHALNKNFKAIYLVGNNFFNINLKSKHLKLFKTFDELQNEISSINFSNSHILIKGSRGMALERILKFI